MPILELPSELGGRTREDLEPSQDRIIDVSMLEERRASVADVVVDQPDALGDVFELASDAVASRLIRSAARPSLVSCFTSTSQASPRRAGDEVERGVDTAGGALRGRD